MSDLAADNARLRAERDALKDQVAWLCGDGMDEAAALQRLFGLRPTPARLLVMLTRRGMVSKEQAFAALYGDRSDGDEPEFKILDVHLCHLRAPMRRAGLVIETIWGRGWRLTPGSREKLRRLIAAETGAETSTQTKG